MITGGNRGAAERDEARAEAADLKARLDASTMEVARLTAERVLDDQRAKMVPPAWETEALRGNLDDAKAEIARLRAELEAARDVVTTAHAVIDSHRTAPPSDADGHYWTEQGGRHVLSVLRPVDLAVVHAMPGSERFGWEVDTLKEHGFSATLERARAHAELAAGVRRLGGGA